MDARFSSGIKDLIGEMLSLDPERRPDLEDILRKTLIKRHIGVRGLAAPRRYETPRTTRDHRALTVWWCGVMVVQEFFEDIMTRPSSSLGEGTIAVRAGFLQAAQGGAGGKLVGSGSLIPFHA